MREEDEKPPTAKTALERDAIGRWAFICELNECHLIIIINTFLMRAGLHYYYLVDDILSTLIIII